jgi:hypothetical protein
VTLTPHDLDWFRLGILAINDRAHLQRQILNAFAWSRKAKARLGAAFRTVILRALRVRTMQIPSSINPPFELLR